MSDEKQDGVDRVTLNSPSGQIDVGIANHGSEPLIVDAGADPGDLPPAPAWGALIGKSFDVAGSNIRDLALGHAITSLAKHIGLNEHHADKVIPLAAKYEAYLLNGLKDETHGS